MKIKMLAYLFFSIFSFSSSLFAATYSAGTGTAAGGASESKFYPAGEGSEASAQATYPAGQGNQATYPAGQGNQATYPAGEGTRASSSYDAGTGRAVPDGGGGHHKRHHHHRDRSAVFFNFTPPPVIVPPAAPDFEEEEESFNYIPNDGSPSRYAVRWVNANLGSPIPYDAVVGGSQSRPYATLYVCRGNYAGGVHPGKLIGGKCNIAWGNREITLSGYQILASKDNLDWVEVNGGEIPDGAIRGGYEGGKILYICQAYYRGGRHPGKVWNHTCSIGWGGQSHFVPNYSVLVR